MPDAAPTARDAADPAGRFAAAAGIVVAAAPLAMAVSSRSLPAVLALALGFAIAGALAAGLRGPLERGWWNRKRVAAASGALLAAALLGLSAARAGFAGFGEALSCAALAAVSVAVLPRILPRWTPFALALGMIAALILVAYELSTGLAARQALGLRPQSFVFNRPVVVCVMLLWPVALLLVRRGALGRALCFGLGVVLVAVASMSESGSAVFGLAIGAAAAVAGLLAPRIAVLIAVAVTVLGFALAPVAGDLAARLLPERVHETYAQSNTKARVEIWQDFGATVPFAPVIGHGFNTTRLMAGMAVASQVPPDRARLLGAGHPHNAILQIWVELGALGALAALAGCLAVLRVIWRTSRTGAAMRLAAYATIFSIAYVSHGAWQGWWLAAIGLAAALFGMDAAARSGGKS